MQKDITSLEALGIAIRDLIDTQELYQKLSQLSNNDVLKDRFMNLYYEEKKHTQLLKKKYKEMFPTVELILPESQIPKDVLNTKQIQKLSIKDLLQLAIDGHKRAREFYLDCAETVTDLSGKRMFRFLADMKFSHQMMLSAELEMLEKYPAYLENIKGWDVETRFKTEK